MKIDIFANGNKKLSLDSSALVYLFLFLIHPFVIFHFYRHLLFDTPGPDDLMALGSSINFDFIPNILHLDRRLDRLPSVLFTYVFFKIFPPMAAHYILFFVSCYAITFLVYLLVREILSRESAVLAAFLFGISFWAIPSFGMVWINRQILIFFFLALLFAALYIRREKKALHAALSGFFTSCAFFSHFAAVPFMYAVPLLPVVAGIVNKDLALRSFVRFSCQFLAGFVGCFVFFGLINRLFFHGPFLFFANQLATSQTDYTSYLRGFRVVYGNASNSLIIFAFAASVGLLLRRGFSDKIKASVALWFIATTALYAVFYYVGTFFPKSCIFSFVLWFWYYSRWIIPFCSLALFSALIPAKLEWRPWSLVVVYAALVFTITPTAMRFFSFLNRRAIFLEDTTHLAYLGVFAVLCVFLLPKKIGGFAAVLMVVLSNMVSVHRSAITTRNGYVDDAFYSRIYNGNRFIQSLDLHAPFYSWLGPNKHEYGAWYEYKSYCKLWLLENNFVDGFPVFGTDKETQFNPETFKVGNNILIVDEDKSGQALDAANGALLRYGRKLIETNSTSVGEGVYRYSLLFCRVSTDLANFKKRMADLSVVKNALETYRAQHHSYPVSKGWDGLHSPWGYSGKDWIPALTPRYLKTLPDDPRGEDNPRHQYMYKSDGKDFKLIAHEPEDYADVRDDKSMTIDPVRESMGSCAYGFWTAGAANWR